MIDTKKLLGQRIKQFRKSKNLTQEELAEIIDIEIPSLSNIETGKFAPSIDTLTKLSGALEKELWEFYYFNKLSNEQMLDEIMTKTGERPELIKILFNFLKAIE